jgi:hypothetical protein
MTIRVLTPASNIGDSADRDNHPRKWGSRDLTTLKHQNNQWGFRWLECGGWLEVCVSEGVGEVIIVFDAC